MATLRTMHKRRKRKLLIAAQPCLHLTVKEYADGAYCQRCGRWFDDESLYEDEPVFEDSDEWDGEETPWCYGCDEPESWCTCGDPIDLYDFLTQDQDGAHLKDQQ